MSRKPRGPSKPPMTDTRVYAGGEPSPNLLEELVAALSERTKSVTYLVASREDAAFATGWAARHCKAPIGFIAIVDQFSLYVLRGHTGDVIVSPVLVANPPAGTAEAVEHLAGGGRIDRYGEFS